MTRSPATPLPPPKERRRLREAASLTHTQLAERAGVTRDTVRAWESGRTTPRGRKREAYAKLLADLADLAEETAAQAEQTATQATGSAEPAAPPVPVVVTAGAASAEPAAVLTKTADSLVLPARPLRDTVPGTPPLTPAQTFDALYDFGAPALVRQTYLLTGRRDLARESVERAFQQAWERWPEVARDRDPVGWVRSLAYEYALSPWHRFRLRHRHPEAPPADPADRTLMNVLLRLPPPHRRTLVLYDGVGLDLPETAAETEASTPAAACRLMRAREALADRVPELADPEVLHRRLAELASAERLRAAGPTAVRLGSERRAKFLTRIAIAFTAALIGTTSLTLRTAPTHYEPPVSPGQPVRGVPPRTAPGPLSDTELELRQKLRDEAAAGPERLSPSPG
ncbi:helix-turn-helix domain-containing protein [Streptomyces sp. NPDC048182]|uniref:helix-turn-helix domain-containing protein n=1 Tax=Streptomyces sp. NPDC048182 TaxID=3365507 RepID=UPI0037118F73